MTLRSTNPLLLALAATAAVLVDAAPGRAQSAQASAQAVAVDRVVPECVATWGVEPVGLEGVRAEFVRILEIRGQAASAPDMVRRWSDTPVVEACGEVPWSEQLAAAGEVRGWEEGGLWLRVLPVDSRLVVNTGYPSDKNNGALWAGRGLSTALSGGVGLRWGALSAAVAPELMYQGNAEFVVSSLGRDGLDYPQRMGTTSFALLDPGRSFVRVDAYGVTAGVSTENLWLGPGRMSSILLSATGPGFPHAFLGTSTPADIWIGRLSAEAFWGRLSESTLFDEDADNDHRLLAVLALGFEPRGARGLHLGAARLFQQNIPPSGLSAGDYIPFFRGPLKTGEAAATDASDEMFAFYLRWVLPESGFEVYGEWAKYDGNADLHDALVEPDNGRTYLLGLQKVLEAGDRWVRLHGEFANLNPSLSILHRQTGGGIYRHPVIRQGHTHRGQLLGAWTGPGSDYQVAGGDLISGWGMAGVFVERVRRNVDVYYSSNDLRLGYPLKHDVELTVGTRGTYLWRAFQIDAGLAFSHRRNRDFLPLDVDELERGFRVDSNWAFQLGLSWYPDADIVPVR